MNAFSDLSDDELADDICTWAGRVAAGTARLLALVAEFDRREGWTGPGLLSCAHWLSWRIGLAPGTAREWVRVARRLTELPAVREAFEAGRMSWSQARAITRVATEEDGIDWVDLAAHSSAGQLECLARGVRRAQRIEEVAADPEEAAYQLRTRHRYDDDGNLVLTIYAPAEYAPVILAGIEAQRAELDRQRHTEASAHAADDVQAIDAPTDPVDVPAGTRSEPDSGDGSVADGSAVDIPPETWAGPDAEPEDRSGVDVPAGTPDRPFGASSAMGSCGWTVEQVRAALARSPWFRMVLAEGDTAEEAAARMARSRRRPDPAVEVPDGVPAGTPDLPAQAPPGQVRSEPVSPADSPPETTKATDGEALLAMARAALDTQQAEHPEISRRTRSQLVAQIDPLSGWGRLRDGELLPPSSLKEVMRTLPGRGGTVPLRPLTAADLTAHDLGRSTREPSLALRELLGTVDGERCRFPGCTRYRKLHAHHVTYWSRDGRTDLNNIILLCSRHHTLVHQHDIQLTLHPNRSLDVRTADRFPIAHHPAQPWADPVGLDPTGQITADTLPPTHCAARLDLGYAVSVLLQQAA